MTGLSYSLRHFRLSNRSDCAAAAGDPYSIAAGANATANGPSERVCDAAIGLPARPRAVQRIDRSEGVTRRATEFSVCLSLSLCRRAAAARPDKPDPRGAGERRTAKP